MTTIDDAIAQVIPATPAAIHRAAIIANVSADYEALRAEAHDPEGETGDGGSFEPIELAPILAGIYIPIRPTILARTDGPRALYPGKVHVLAAEQGAFKTWLALAAAAGELSAGRRVVWVDYEMGAPSLVERLRLLGVSDADIHGGLVLIPPSGECWQPADTDRLLCIIGAAPVTLVVVDSLGEALTANSIDERENHPVRGFLASRVRPLADAGPAVLLLDHVTKDATTRDGKPIGAQAKGSAAHVLLYLSAGEPGAPGRVGTGTLIVRKDRHAALNEVCGERRVWAHVRLDATDRACVRVYLAPPTDETRTPDDGAAVLEVLRHLGGWTTTASVQRAVKRRKADVLADLAGLVEGSRIERRDGARGATEYRILRARTPLSLVRDEPEEGE